MLTDFIPEIENLIKNTRIRKITIQQEGASISITQPPPLINSTKKQMEEPEEPHSLVVSKYIGFFTFNKTPLSKGDTIEEGKVFGCIRSLGRDYQLIANSSGVISDVLVKEGQGVEYAQPILKIKG